jgi:hypothetical protein
MWHKEYLGCSYMIEVNTWSRAGNYRKKQLVFWIGMCYFSQFNLHATSTHNVKPRGNVKREQIKDEDLDSQTIGGNEDGERFGDAPFR